MSTNEIYNYVERINNLLRTDSRQKIAEHGLQPIQLEALHYLSICNKYSNTPMAVTDYLGQTKGTVSQTLKVLERKNYLSKHSDKNDKRIAHLKLTRLGHKLINESIPTPKFTRACEEFPEDIQAEVVTALNHLLLSFLHSNDMESFGVCSSCRYHQEDKPNHYSCGLVQEPLSDSERQQICREHEFIEAEIK